jgi:predicted transcriptional regulator of viral defense system
MNGKKTIKILEKYPVFTINDFVRITGNGPKYSRTCIYRMKKDGLIFQIERGKYTVFDDPMIFSSHILAPSYISFWTGLRFYNLTEQLPADIMLVSPKQKKPIKFQGTKIQYFKTGQMWGYGKQRYMGFDIFVADKEKCILDSLMIKNVPFDEIAKAIRTKDFDPERLVEYALKAKNVSVIKRVGYMMEASGMDPAGLAGSLDGNYILLDWSGPKKGGKNRKWKIIANRRLDDIY